MPDLPHPSRPEIVKLGGSLIGHPRLPALLDALARRGAPLVLVAGGGPLADGVRALQPRLALSDAACHRMAILAMEQTAIAFADLSRDPSAPGLALADTREALAEAHAQRRAALWLPARMVLAASDLPESWELDLGQSRGVAGGKARRRPAHPGQIARRRAGQHRPRMGRGRAGRPALSRLRRAAFPAPSA
ncbi:hypothetical protein ACFSKM_17595 [Ancylobacter dichloromethanicus]